MHSTRDHCYGIVGAGRCGAICGRIGVCETMALKEWIKSTGEKIREAIEQALPPPTRPERIPVRIPIPVNPPRPTRHYH